MIMWLKGDDGKPSVSTSLVAVSFVVTTVAYALSIVEKVGPVSIRPFDIAACSSYFIPVLTLYFGRKASKASVTKAMLAQPEPEGDGGKPLP